ncbi:PREDICTED: Bloom syndrome protein homolog [Priapulus caudatus]|uniref:DNA 3'-5' helicase n=1 Tax=Priapulus caudatus TaxID=37621 RepID=A0ABM1F2I2_PRICU|nr:PREDICTED: Bloom syndrome protein homolog [Priapulus caudatus]
MCPEDVVGLGLWRHELAVDVMELIEEIESPLRISWDKDENVDQADDMIEMATSAGQGADFRKEYRRINEIHSVVSTGTPFLALTATATEQMRKEIVEALGMSPDTTTVAVTPDRSNITYSFKKTKKNIGEDLQWLVEQTRSTTPKKVIVYCRNIANCATLFEHFMLELADDAYVSKERSLNTRVVGMYHRSTSDSNKQHVLDTFPKADFNLCVVFATIAFGMGVNIPDVDIVVHWGSPRGIEQFAQESGRAGRDVESERQVEDNSVPDLTETRDLSPDQLQLLRDNLCDFRVCLLEEIVTPVFGQRDLLIGFSHENIDSIVNSACFLMCPEDVVGLGLWRHELAVDVLELIEEIESL